MSEREEAGPSRYPKTIRCSSCVNSGAFSSNLQSEEQQATLSFPKMGKWRRICPHSHTSGLWIWLYTNVKLESMVVVSWDLKPGHLSWI